MRLRLLAVSLVMSSGCWNHAAFYDTPPSRPARPVSSVPVYACAPPRPYEVLGVLESHRASLMPILASWAALDEPRVLEDVVRLAARHGCEALVLKPPQACDAGIHGYQLSCLAFLDGGLGR